VDNKTAATLLASLMERVECEQTIGIMSSLERQALRRAIVALSDGKRLDLSSRYCQTTDYRNRATTADS
jgi:hypothetical protein